MRRFVYNKLVAWKNKPNSIRKPLVLQGARQVGKTWLLEELGKREFESVAIVNFEENKQLSTLFESDFDTERILRSIEIATDIKLIPGKTLIVFDEIQSVRRGLLSLKYLLKNAPEYHVAAAGSLLGISIHKEDSFPVGKVEFIDVLPLSFDEFMIALGKETMVENINRLDWELITTFKEQYADLLKQYYFIGGMPEIVANYIEQKDFKQVRALQLDLLRSYDADFSKHPPIDIIPRIKMVWNSIPSQLARENKKFIFNAVKPGGRAKDFELAIEWLKQAGLLYKITRINNATLPLDGFEDVDAYKLFILDVGLLGALSGLDVKTLIDGNAIFTQYKGALTEQYVLQQLLYNNEIKIHYWTPNTGNAEVDFVVQLSGKIIPIEVKAEENLKAKSLRSFNEKYKHDLSIRTSMSNFRVETNLTNIPLFALPVLEKLL